MDHPTQTEHIHLKHSAHLHLFALLDCCKIPNTGIVNQDVDVAELFLGSFDGGVDLFLIRHIKLKDQCLALAGQISDIIRTPGSDNGAKATLQQMCSQLTTKTSGTTGNEPNRFFDDFQIAIR